MKTNTFIQGDCLDVLEELPFDCVDLIYLDPPFCTGRDWVGEAGTFSDKWDEGLKSYLEFMRERLVEMKRVLKDTGSIYLHCDQTASHYLKIEMDKIFGVKNFRNEIIWKRYRGKRAHKNPSKFPVVIDSILFYSNGGNIKFDLPFTPLDAGYVKKAYRNNDNDGLGLYRYGGRIRDRKYYLKNSRGTPSTSLWDDVPELNGTASEDLGYPTQKPIALLKRIIQTSSNKNDVVLDPFCGSGTTCDAANQLDRKYIGIDISEDAINLSKKRLGIMS